MTSTKDHKPRAAAAILARRQHAARLLGDVRDALTKIRQDNARVTFRTVATRADVSRTFLYENSEARRLVEDAIAATNQQRRQALTVTCGFGVRRTARFTLTSRPVSANNARAAR